MEESGEEESVLFLTIKKSDCLWEKDEGHGSSFTSLG